MRSAYTGRLSCPRCGEPRTEAQAFELCPPCLAEGQHVNPMPVYDLSVPGLFRAGASAGRGIFRHRALLPLRTDGAEISLGEGDTPVVPLRTIGARLGLDELYLKDESRNPTWSYKDRLAAVGISQAVDAAAGTVVVSSTGNHGAAVAAYAAAAGLRCIALTLESVPLTMKVLMQSYGAQVVALRRPTDRWVVMAQGVRERGWVPLSGFVSPPAGSNPFAVDGYKTMAYELVEQLGRAPDVVITPVAYGDGIAGLHRGFDDLRQVGMIERQPRLIAAEVFGAYSAALAGTGPGGPSEQPTAPSAAFSIATPHASFQGYQAIDVTGGAAVAVADDRAILAAQADLARSEGLYLEASSVIPVAGLPELVRRGVIAPDDLVVCIGTSTGLKDIGATAGTLGPVPVIEPTLASLEQALQAG